MGQTVDDECYPQVVTVTLCWQLRMDNRRTDIGNNAYLALTVDQQWAITNFLFRDAHKK